MADLGRQIHAASLAFLHLPGLRLAAHRAVGLSTRVFRGNIIRVLAVMSHKCIFLKTVLSGIALLTSFVQIRSLVKSGGCCFRAEWVLRRLALGVGMETADPYLWLFLAHRVRCSQGGLHYLFNIILLI